MRDHSTQFIAQIQQAIHEQTGLRIEGGGSKRHWHPIDDAATLHTQQHSGILNYQPTELVITARSGTPLMTVLETLQQQKQYLMFEPPILAEHSTLGGVVASGLTGPNRPWGGSLRDSLLGVSLINGKAERLSFGGEVFKNVAGFDLFRLQAGAWGSLGLINDISLRVNPAPQKQLFKKINLSLAEAHKIMIEWQQKPYPFSGLAWVDGQLRMRLFGMQASLDHCLAELDLPFDTDEAQFWYDLRDFNHTWLTQTDERVLWRMILPPAAPFATEADESILLNWGGGCRWLKTIADPETIFQRAQSVGGFAERWHTKDQPLFNAPKEANLLALTKSLKQAFDPHQIFNRHMDDYLFKSDLI